jgi:uncharacterized membrane protein YfcA
MTLGGFVRSMPDSGEPARDESDRGLSHRMMGSCAFLMPVAGLRFIASGRYDRRAALGLALGGIPGVLIAAFLVKQLPLLWLRWLVVLVVLYAAFAMLRAAMKPVSAESP